MQTLFTETQVARGITGLLHIPAPYLAYGVSCLLLLICAPLVPSGGVGDSVVALSLPIVCGFYFGRRFYRKLPTITAFFAWVLPGVFLTYSAVSWQHTMAQYDSTWSTYFGKDCGGSECLYQLFLTGPFYTSVAYSLGALSVRLKKTAYSD
jgi:hypothetical protein